MPGAGGGMHHQPQSKHKMNIKSSVNRCYTSVGEPSVGGRIQGLTAVEAHAIKMALPGFAGSSQSSKLNTTSAFVSANSKNHN